MVGEPVLFSNSTPLPFPSHSSPPLPPVPLRVSTSQFVCRSREIRRAATPHHARISSGTGTRIERGETLRGSLRPHALRSLRCFFGLGGGRTSKRRPPPSPKKHLGGARPQHKKPNPNGAPPNERTNTPSNSYPSSRAAARVALRFVAMPLSGVSQPIFSPPPLANLLRKVQN